MALKAFFFDLDYTLYDQQQYLRGAFRSVAHVIADACYLNAELLYQTLLAVWERKGTDYQYLFNDWLESLGLCSQARIQGCVDTFHAYQPEKLMLYPGIEQTLCDLKRDYLLGLVTDGNLQMQQSKVRALSLEKHVDFIVYARQLSLSKPDPRILWHALDEAGLLGAEVAYVGDHPVKDIVGARRAGMLAIRIMSGEFRELPDDLLYPPTLCLATVNEVPGVLSSLDSLIQV